MKRLGDVKTLVIGILLGILLAIVMGQASSGAGKADFAIAMDNRGFALVRANDGVLYVVDPETERAEIVEYRGGPYKGSAFSLNRSILNKESK